VGVCQVAVAEIQRPKTLVVCKPFEQHLYVFTWIQVARLNCENE